MKDSMDRTGDSNRMCVDTLSQRQVYESSEKERMNDSVTDYDQEAVNEDILRRATGGRPRSEAPQQQVSRPSPETEAMGQMLMEAINREVGLRAQLIEAKRLLEAEVAP
jgi:hypothetical protein